MKTLESEVKSRLSKPRPPEPTIQAEDLLSTGSTLLDLACSGRLRGGFAKGHYYLIVGDSNAGKTWICNSTLAEAAINKHFDGYRLIYDNPEDGVLMDLEKFFGKAAKRIEPPARDKTGNPIYSSTVEEFYFHVDDAVDHGKPFIYICDSMDSLSSETEGDKFKEQKAAYLKGKAVSGSYGDGKAKKNSAGIRQALHKLKRTGSILIVVAQTRDRVAGYGFDSKTRSGGHALKFYATIEIWASIIKKLTADVKGKELQTGIVSRFQVKRTRVTGAERAVEVPIYWSHGIDNTGSCVRYLVDWKHWPKASGIIHAKEFNLKLDEEALIRHIEEQGMERELQVLVQGVWREIDAKCSIQRKKRY
jgi:RecA/RadA recombinase